MRISDWATKFGYQVVAADKALDAAVWAGAATKFVVKDIFTTVNGQWAVDATMGSIPQWAIDAYNKPEFDDKGGATHLFALVLNADGSINKNTQVATWSDGYQKLAGFDWKSKPAWLTILASKPTSGWANQYIEHSSAFAFENGAHGPWCMKKAPGLSDVVTGLGLPNSWHISTFVVFQEVSVGAVVTPPPDPSPTPTPVPTDLLPLLQSIDATGKALLSAVQGLIKHLGG